MRAMNLLPVEERGGARAPGAASRLTAVHALAGAGAVVAVGMLGTYALAKKDTASAREAEAAAVSRSATAQAHVDRLAPVVAFDARRQARESAVLALAAGRTDWAGVLSATAGALPSNVTVTTLKLQAADATGGAAGATAAPAGLAGTGTVTLNVCADTQPRVATTLRRFRALPQVEDVALSQTARAASASGASGGASATGGAGCSKVSADAALGLSAATVIDGAAAAAAGTATAPGAPASTGTPATTSAPTTTGTSR